MARNKTVTDAPDELPVSEQVAAQGVDAELRARYGLPSEDGAEAATSDKARRPGWVETLPMPFMIACALLGPRFLVDGEIGYLAALGLGFGCALLGGIFITIVIVLVHKILYR